MKTTSLSALMVISITAISLLVFTLSTTLAHASLVRSDPAPDAKLDQPPMEVSVWFSEPLSTGSNLTVFDTQFQSVDTGDTFIAASDATLMRVELKPLTPGRYTVNWKANSVDGHSTSGSYDFFVTEGPGIPILLQVALAVIIAVIALIFLVNWIANRLRLRRVIRS